MDLRKFKVITGPDLGLYQSYEIEAEDIVVTDAGYIVFLNDVDDEEKDNKVTAIFNGPKVLSVMEVTKND